MKYKRWITLLIIECLVFTSLFGLYCYREGFITFSYLHDEPAIIEDGSADFKMETLSEEELISYATLTAVGDIMMHGPQITRGYDKETDTFDYADAFTYVEPYLSESDFTVGNLETTLAGRYEGATQSVYGYSDYPRFNAPEILATNLKDAGFDLLGTANNHSMDSGVDGVYATLDYLDEVSMLHTGTARDEAEQDSLCLVEVNRITFGFCAYTYGTNGLTVPSNAAFAVNTLNNYKEENLNEMCEQVKKLKEAGADVVITMVHFGTEYVTKPGNIQKEVTDALFQAGTDVILGSHPHVLQPMEIRSITNDDGSQRTGVVIYSLGNFISSQTNLSGDDKDIGVIMDIRFKKVNGQVTIEWVELCPTYVYWSDDVIGVVPIVDAYENPEKYDFLNARGVSRVSYGYKNTIVHLTQTYGISYTLENGTYHIPVESYSNP